MKFVPAIVIALAAVFLALAGETNAKSTSFSYNNGDVISRIRNHALGTVNSILKFKQKYAQMSKSMNNADLDGARYALVSKLFFSIAATRFHGIVYAADDDLVGNNFKNEFAAFQMHTDSLDSQVDVKLESLLKLAGELKEGHQIGQDVKAVIEKIADDTKFLDDLSDEFGGDDEEQ